MSVIKKDYYKTFHDSVRVSFGKIATDYGLQLEPVDEGSFKLPLKGFEIKIDLGFGHLADVNVLIAPTNDQQQQRNLPGIGLLNFVEYQNPNFSFIDLRLREPEELPQKLEVLSRLLRKSCDSFLRGDFSIWPKMVAFVEDKIRCREKGRHRKKLFEGSTRPSTLT